MYYKLNDRSAAAKCKTTILFTILFWRNASKVSILDMTGKDKRLNKKNRCLKEVGWIVFLHEMLTRALIKNILNKTTGELFIEVKFVGKQQRFKAKYVFSYTIRIKADFS